MSRIIAFTYGVVSYAVFFGTFLYAAGFVGNLMVPKTLDGVPTGALGASVAIDLGLLALFAVQHSVMARPAFKRWWTRIVPTAVERSTYVLASSVALLLLFWQWRPLGGVVWDVDAPIGRAVLHAGFVFGWLLVLATTFLINHFDLFGLRQVWLHLRGRPYTPLHFTMPGPYKLVRHPLYVGWLFAFWSTPTMTATHLLFAVATTAYILIAIRFEERDLLAVHPEYARYQERVPMLVPLGRGQDAVAAVAPGRAKLGAGGV
jgi:protein-S-isoprenylcysteine O-methyltransferase Ste14